MDKLSASYHFYRRLIKTSLKQSASLKWAFILRIICMLLNNCLMLVSWGALFYTFKTINGWNIYDFIFMTGLCVGSFSIWSIFFRGAGIYMARQIEYGDLDAYIIQPRHILFHGACSVSDPSGIGDLITGILFIGISGLVTFQTFPIVLVCFICATLCFIALTFYVSCLPFFIKQTDDFGERLFYIFFNIAGYPGSIYSGWFKLIFCSIFPVGIISILPVTLLKHFSWEIFGYLIGFTGLFFAGALILFHYGLRRYESGNRFGVHGQ